MPLKEEKEVYCYARVSSNKQKEDLKRQIDFLKNKVENGKIIKDIGSGLNYNRKGFQQLLEKVVSGSVEKVYVTYRDRLCRYGIELVDFIFKQNNVELVVLCKGNETNGETEFSEDIINICNYYCAKYNGKKAAYYRKQRSCKTGEVSIENE